MVPGIWIEDSPPKTGPASTAAVSGHAAVGVSSAGAVGHRLGAMAFLTFPRHGETVGASWSYQLFSAAHDRLGDHFCFEIEDVGFSERFGRVCCLMNPWNTRRIDAGEGAGTDCSIRETRV